MIFALEEVSNGAEVREEGSEQGQARDARAEARNAQVRPVRKEGHQPEAGDRDRPLGGAQGGSEGPEEEGRLQEEVALPAAGARQNRNIPIPAANMTAVVSPT